MRLRTFGPAAIVLSITLVVFACNEESTVTPPPSTPLDAAAAADAGAAETSSDAGSSELPDPPPLGRFGAVFAISDDTSGGQAHSFGGFFVNRTVADDTVTKTKVGPCTVEVFGSGVGPTETDLSAGTLSFSGGTMPLMLNPLANKTYTAVQGAGAIFNGGQTISVAAAGNEVPAFTVSVTAPSKITLATPALPMMMSEPLVIDRATGFSATWATAPHGVVVLYFDATDASNAYSATCEFPASVGSATIPANVFADFPAVDGTFNFYSKQAAVVTPDGVYVRFTASSVAVGPTGTGAKGIATFQ